MSRKKKKKAVPGPLKRIRDFGLFVFFVLILTYILSNYVFERIVVINFSMLPTLESEDSVLVDKISYEFREPKRMDVIVFRGGNNNDELIKRVIALPGESVRIEHGNIYINDKKLNDVNGLDKPKLAGLADNTITLGSDEYFCLGDNREESIDSRYQEIGNIERDKIIGRAIMVISPAKHFGFL